MSQRLKNVIILNDYAWVNGGTGQVAISSAHALAVRGHQVLVFSAHGEPNGEYVHPNLTITSVGEPRIQNLDGLQRLAGSLNNRRVGEAFGALLAQFDPAETIVHVHSWKDALSLAVFEVLRRTRFQWVLTAHDYSVACPYSGFYNYSTNQICRLKAMSWRCRCTRCNDGSIVRKALSNYRQLVQMNRYGIPRRVPHLIMVSDFERDVLAPYLEPGQASSVLLNPISVEKKDRLSPGASDHYLFVGRLSREKGPSIALAAAREAGARIKVIGDGVLRASLQREFPEAEFLGWRSNEETLELIRQSRGLLFTSVWYETFGLTAYEAAAVGVPVLVSDASATRDSVARYGHGLEYHYRTPENLVHLLKRFASDEEVEAFGKAGYEAYWKDPLTMDRHVDQLTALYESLLP